MRKTFQTALWFLEIIVGCSIFALGFNLFLRANNLNSGGISGISMIIVHLLGKGSVGALTILINLPLFVLGGWKIGKKFFVGSIVGMIASSVALDLFAYLPTPEVDTLLASLYGGVTCGFGLGMVFATGASTGGSDIIVRLLKRKWQNVPIGIINICFDLTVATLTGLAFWDVSSALYSGVSIFVTGKVIDAVVYSFDYSKVALIISREHEKIVKIITQDLDRGATYLHGEGAYSGKETKVILTAIKRQQLADLKRLVSEVDPNAFIIVQEAHQVLGDGFSRYSKESL